MVGPVAQELCTITIKKDHTFWVKRHVVPSRPSYMPPVAQKVHLLLCTMKVHDGDMHRDTWHNITMSAQVFWETISYEAFEEIFFLGQ